MNSQEELSQIQWFDSLSKFKQWYDKNKQALSAKRKHKYLTDPAYRAKIREYQHERNKVRSKQSKQSPQSQYRETILGQMVRAYSLEEASQLIRRQVWIIPQWERKGLIPPPIFPAPRAYTHHQVMLIRELVYIITKGYARRISNGKVKAEIAEQQAKIVAHWQI